MSRNSEKQFAGKFACCLLLTAFCLLAIGCRYDMQDQPRYRAQKKSEFFNDNKAMRELPEGTVARGLLRDDKAFYTGKNDAGTGGGQPTGNAGGGQSATSGAGGGAANEFAGLIDEFPVPVTKELLDRGEQRYKIFCMACHGPLGYGDGMIVRRGFPKPPAYHDDRLRNAPVGHFYDVITNGFGKMNPYNSQVPPADRWAIVAYIRALQISQNPNGIKPLPTNTPTTAPTNNANTVTTTNNANTATTAITRTTTAANTSAARPAPRATTTPTGGRR